MFPLIPCKLTECGLCLCNKVVVCYPHNQHSLQLEKHNIVAVLKLIVEN